MSADRPVLRLRVRSPACPFTPSPRRAPFPFCPRRDELATNGPSGPVDCSGTQPANRSSFDLAVGTAGVDQRTHDWILPHGTPCGSRHRGVASMPSGSTCVPCASTRRAAVEIVPHFDERRELIPCGPCRTRRRTTTLCTLFTAVDVSPGGTPFTRSDRPRHVVESFDGCHGIAPSGKSVWITCRVERGSREHVRPYVGGFLVEVLLVAVM